MKINFLLDDSQTALQEHLGSLEAIDKELIKGLLADRRDMKQNQGFEWTPPRHSYDSPPDARYRERQPAHTRLRGDSPRSTLKVPETVGRNSSIEDRQLEASEATELLSKAKTTDVAAIIIMVEDKQVGIVTTDDQSSFNWIFTARFRENELKAAIGATGKTLEQYLDRPAGSKSSSWASGTISSGKNIKGSLEGFFGAFAIYEWGKLNPNKKTIPKTGLPKINVKVVKADVERKELKAARKNLQANRVPTPRDPALDSSGEARYTLTSHNHHIQQLFALLKHKLNKLKNSRSAAFEDTESMLKHILSEGYIKKVTYFGAVFNLANSRIEMDDLLRGDKAEGKSFLEYVAEGRTSYGDEERRAAYAEYHAEIKELAKKAPEPPAGSYYDDETRRKEWPESWARQHLKHRFEEIATRRRLPPSKLIVRFTLDRGVIVPFKIQADYSYF